MASASGGWTKLRGQSMLRLLSHRRSFFMRLPVFAGCLAMLVVAPALAQTPAAAPDALVERFIAALPHQEEFDPPATADARRLAQFGALNPGREQEVRTILTAEATCSAPAIR